MIRKPASLALPLLAAAALLTAGCAASAGADPAATKSAGPSGAAQIKPGKPALVGSQWRLKTDPTAWFRVLGSNITGSDSCNNLMGTATSLASADRVDFGAGLASTMKYCPDPNGTQTAISEALKGERQWTRNGTELVLTDPDNNRTWTFVLTPAGAPASTSATPAAASPSTVAAR